MYEIGRVEQQQKKNTKRKEREETTLFQATIQIYSENFANKQIGKNSFGFEKKKKCILSIPILLIKALSSV